MVKVMIGGVDVSECEYCLNNKLKGKGHAPAKSMPYAKETSCIECKTNSTRYNFCKHNPNCYYKQLQRARAEIEKLKAEKEELQALLNNITVQSNNEITALQTENEKLKTENEELKKQVKNNETAYQVELGTYNMECGNLLEENKTLIAENERIKRDFLKQNQWLQDQKKEIDELKTENERLNEIEKEISDFISDISTCGFRYDDRCPDNLDELQQCIEDLCNKFDNYKQALQEIREIAKEQLQDVSDRCINTTPMYIVHKHIIDKINEVIGAEE